MLVEVACALNWTGFAFISPAGFRQLATAVLHCKLEFGEYDF